MTLLILSPRHTPDSNTLWKAALDQNWSIERLYKYRVPEHITSSSAKIYGENLFAEIVAEQLGISLIGTQPSWLANLPDDYLKRKVEYKYLKECREFRTPQFIKPASGKLFDAKVYQSGQELPSNDSQDDDTPVLISEPVEWVAEFRCFVSDRKLKTLSLYRREDELNFDVSEPELQLAQEFCQSILDDSQVKLPPSLVIDVGQIQNKGWAIVEANPTFASGIYNCDPIAVLHCIDKSCVPASDISSELTPWILN